MTLGEFRGLTKDLPDAALVGYHAYYKGCCLGSFDMAGTWIHRNDDGIVVAMNPGDDYDEREGV